MEKLGCEEGGSEGTRSIEGIIDLVGMFVAACIIPSRIYAIACPGKYSYASFPRPSPLPTA